MKNIFTCVLFMVFGFPLFAQKMEVWHNPPPVVCPHGGENVGGHKYVPPPKNWQNYLKNGRIEARSKIEVEYIGFSDSAKVAFQKAVDIWQSLLISPVTIRIRAEWKALASGVLGAAGPNGLIRNFEGAPRLGVWYPRALAEKLHGKNLNKPEEFDINATFNSNQTAWYYGTDGRTPTNKFDLVYIVLHELGHGLGFTAVTIDVANDKGVWFDGSAPQVADIFSTFVESGLEKKPITAYPNNTTELATVLTSGQVHFNSPATSQSQ